MNKFVFNSRDSFEDMNCIIVAPISFPSIREEVENVPIEKRRAGSLTKKTGNYKDSIITIKMQLNDMEDYKDKMLKINEWLEDIKDNRLIFDNYPEKCYIVKDIKLQDFTNEKTFYSRFDIQFICEPFMRSRNEFLQTIANGYSIFSNSSTISEPYIRLTLPSNKQNIQIAINRVTMQLDGVSGTVEIDSQLMQVIGSEARIKTIGNFPILEKGNNKITWTGTINKFEINKRLYYKG